MHRKLATTVWLGLICLSPPSYTNELLDELIALLPAQEEKSDQEIFHPDLQANPEESSEKLLIYHLQAEEVEERFSLPAEELALLKTAPKKKLKRTPANLIDELNPSLTPKKSKDRYVKEKKPTATLESSQNKCSINPSLTSEKPENSSNTQGFECQKETLPLISPLKAEARILSAKLEKGINAFMTTMMPLVRVEVEALRPSISPAQERLPPNKNSQKALPAPTPSKPFSSRATLPLNHETPLSLTPKKTKEPISLNRSLPTFGAALVETVALISDQIVLEKKFAQAEAEAEKVRHAIVQTQITTSLSPTSSALLGLTKEPSSPKGKTILTPLTKKQHFAFSSANHLAELELPEKIREIGSDFINFAKKAPQRKEKLVAPTELTSILVSAESSKAAPFILKEQLLLQQRPRELRQVKIPTPKLSLALVQQLPETEVHEPITLHILQPKSEKQDVHFEVESRAPAIAQTAKQPFHFEKNDGTTIITSFNELEPKTLTKIATSLADVILAMPIEMESEEKDPLQATSTSAAEEPTWTTNITMALSKASVPLLASKPLIEKERLQAGNLLFAEEKLRDRSSHERHMSANRLYRKSSSLDIEGSNDEMVKIDSPFDPYVEYASDGRGGYYFGIELHLLKDFELPSQKQNFHFMIDRSKATDRVQYEAYKQGVLKALTYLKKGDTFNIYIFDSRNKQLSPIPLPVSKQTIAKARSFLTDEKHGILFRSAKMYNLIEEMVAKVQDETLLTNIVFMAGPKTLSDLRTKRLDVQHLLKTNSQHANLFFITSCDKENFSMMQLLATMNRGQAIYSPTNTSIPRKIANLVHRISKPIGREMHVLTRSDNAQIDLYSSTKLNRAHLYKNNAFKIYGRTDQLEDFEIILQGKGEENWLHMTQPIKLKKALRVGRSLRKTLAGLQVLPLYKRYIDEGIPEHLWEATKITAQHNIEQPYSWD
ncbi:MAG: hypothetical protein SNF33_03520 [Candidatus Algichlamydia australiensis]|nr:hypothetical protein [Chlamydiales bacterium]